MPLQIRVEVDPCQKCGEPDPRISWRDGTQLDCPKSHGFREHFHVECRRCGFRWIEEIKEA